jgi:serine/threonine protein kinase
MESSLDRVRSALAGSYVPAAELGTGGMATVYLARDLKHDRSVALKVLRPELAAIVGSDRFLREIRITARLNHPHILPLLDSGESAGLLWYVMPYVAGGSLRAVLHPNAPLPIEVALRISEQVAGALDHAHRHGIVHRDVKPENILLSEGLAIVADFGIARAVSAAGAAGLTRSGFPIGTPGYMSPEQALGHLDLDGRTDVYSLGCVVYEMLVGATPAVLPSPDDGKMGRFLEAPPDHRARLDLLPGRVEQALVKALSVRPADRFDEPGRLAAALSQAAGPSVKLGDDQVRAILGRAAKLQAEERTEEAKLSIGAVEQIAAEVGIPPEHVRAAARELEPSPDSGAPSQVVAGSRGTPPALADAVKPSNVIVVDRTVNGELPSSRFEAVVDDIQSTLGMAGHVTALGHSLTWSPAAPGEEGRKVVVTLTIREGRTRVRIEERLELSGWQKMMPAFGAAGGGLVLLALAHAVGAVEGGAVVLAIMGAAGGAFTAVRAVISTMSHWRGPDLEALANRIGSLAGESTSLPRYDALGDANPALQPRE